MGTMWTSTVGLSGIGAADIVWRVRRVVVARAYSCVVRRASGVGTKFTKAFSIGESGRLAGEEGPAISDGDCSDSCLVGTGGFGNTCRIRIGFGASNRLHNQVRFPSPVSLHHLPRPLFPPPSPNSQPRLDKPPCTFTHLPLARALSCSQPSHTNDDLPISQPATKLSHLLLSFSSN